MQIVIEIPEELKNKIDNANENNYKTSLWGFETTLYCAIKNGTPLPKRHGKLFDSEAYYADVKKHYFDNATVIRCTEIALNNAPTIIEANKESEEKK